MITAERLEELIKQGGTVWFGKHFEIKLNPKQFSIAEQFGETVLYYQKEDEPSGYDWSWELGVLREDVDRAKWEHDMFTERTERFEPPMWEEIERYYRFVFVNNLGSYSDYYTFDVSKDRPDSFAITVDNGGFIFNGEPTKENYIKACEIVRDLFNKGGAK